VLGREGDQGWNGRNQQYLKIGLLLDTYGAEPGAVSMVNNAPGYYVATGKPAISIPYGDPADVREAARRYGARYLVLEFNQLLGPDDLYANPGARPGFDYLTSTDNIRIYEITDNP
jgi:hypothetical protein